MTLAFMRQRQQKTDAQACEAERVQLIGDIKQRILSVFPACEIWLFGSACQAQTFDSASDIDVLIVLPTDEAAGRAWTLSRQVRRGFGRPLDLVFMSEADFERKLSLIHI